MSNETEDRTGEERGALHEIVNDHYSRGRFLKMVGGVGAAAALSTFVAACGGDNGNDGGNGSTATTDRETTEDTETETTEEMNEKPTDLEIVNYALTLEYLEAQFYRDVIDSGLFKGPSLETIRTFGEHEQTHVEALEKTAKSLGTPATAPKATFPLEDAKSVLELAATVENLGAAAYLGQAANITNPEILAAALAIHTVEARHAAALNQLMGTTATPDGAFGKPATMEEVLEQVQPFLAS